MLGGGFGLRLPIGVGVYWMESDRHSGWVKPWEADFYWGYKATAMRNWGLRLSVGVGMLSGGEVRSVFGMRLAFV